MSILPSAAARLAADDLERQIAHWRAAASTFRDAEEFASEQAWRGVEAHTGLPLRRQLASMVTELIDMGRATQATCRSARHHPEELVVAARAVQQYRRRYAQVEVTLDFFGDAVNSRTSPQLRSALQTLDRLAAESMTPVLTRAGHPPIPVLVYLDKGMGASILRAGIRLWTPGSINPVAAIKIVRHNLYRPTSLFHESGHQVAHQTGWTQSLRGAVTAALEGDPPLQAMWAPWSSEIAADVFAFLHTGYASVTALYDVVGDSRTILRWPVGDPHPVGYLRTLLGCALCRRAFGPGPWDSLEDAMVLSHPTDRTDPTVRTLLDRSRGRLAEIARACLDSPVPGLHGRPMTSVLDPGRVSPSALADLERGAGTSLWVSPHWRRTEGIRLIALAGLREAEHPLDAAGWIDRARTWMTTEPLAA
ncbi:hypothetical protein QMG61_12480 [Cryobacterium sp. PH31-AA6]|uniref:hypothetical protein n=1 Tax=Cryobacterium sp. PH31-AA6 TaxID=3046205 RepID=UPI0024B9B7D9|nr:hypothetical protein [Cryobacterium sp. PH31-AA6]MDJ0324572.1 hypothetical protein [Cryobacterium sp. PH31-AA6]